MEEVLRSALLTSSGMSAAAPGGVEWGLRPKIIPCVRLQLVSGVPFYTSGGRDRLTPYLVQADCFGPTYSQAKAVARLVAATIEALARPTFEPCFVLAERDDDDTDASGEPVHRTSLDLRILHHAT